MAAEREEPAEPGAHATGATDQQDALPLLLASRDPHPVLALHRAVHDGAEDRLHHRRRHAAALGLVARSREHPILHLLDDDRRSGFGLEPPDLLGQLETTTQQFRQRAVDALDVLAQAPQIAGRLHQKEIRRITKRGSRRMNSKNSTQRQIGGA